MTGFKMKLYRYINMRLLANSDFRRRPFAQHIVTIPDILSYINIFLFERPSHHTVRLYNPQGENSHRLYRVIISVACEPFYSRYLFAKRGTYSVSRALRN